jgi:hypothetical protein
MKKLILVFFVFLHIAALAQNSSSVTVANKQSAPPGSYLQTCNDVIETGGTLKANCRTIQGNYRKTYLERARNCYAGIENIDGKLVCKSKNHKVSSKKLAAQCFWMENYSGKFTWVSAEAVQQRILTKQECFSLDSCDGGQGGSGGGCYKWANSPEGERFAW